MKLLELLKSEAVRRELFNPDQELDAAAVFLPGERYALPTGKRPQTRDDNR